MNAYIDELVLSLYAKGVSTRDIEAHLREIYAINVSPALISAVTEAVRGDIEAWR